MRIAFFGTPEFSVPSLAALCEAGYEPVLVVSQPSRRQGRGRKLALPPVARFANQHGLALEQPAKVRSKTFLAMFRELEIDLAVVIAFGQIFPKALLEIPTHGCINVHASLLPRHRGAAPVAAAIAAGDSETGVCTMVMEEGLDTGPSLLCRSLAIAPDDTTETLEVKLAELGARVLLDTLQCLEEGTLAPQPQDDTRATYAPRLEKSAGIVDWQQPAEVIERLLRAYTPWPGLETELRGKPLRLLALRVIDGEREGGETTGETEPGQIVAVDRDAVTVACGDGAALELLEVQRPGRRALAARDWINGEQPRVGETLGAAPAKHPAEGTPEAPAEGEP